ncbi:tRNA (adenine(58)-N(1))-methyltransferase non-catalytic subunit TRM6 [Aplysia californica]|uniref:tRNA (adenine(58)-N(1))-methyltransferase non-catalytic subunit TRM6 n=1 Tax=Aplysia californica TaxID=6500 RepID=A0ABM0JJ40_APLCA|nr:tRNA (adenine(58)-N(1))-methyltransferase non-catalytic subunit TRM6 [Aplysia californica]
MSSGIQEGDHVLFRRERSSRVFHIRKNRQVYFEKTKFSVEELIGQPYGSTFEIDRGKLIKVETNRKLELETGEAAAPSADNRNLLDLDSNQKMSKDDIMKLKEEGITGKKIIEELIENSETFRNKTEFSQAKYVKKKKKKHVQAFTALRPTPRLVLDIFAKEPGKICYLRPDSLSQLLNYSNVMCGSQVAVAESCQGLVLACVLQRLGGSGKLIQLIPNNNNTVCRQVMNYFSFPKDHWDCVYYYPLDCLSALEQGATEPQTALSSAAAEAKESVEGRDISESVSSEAANNAPEVEGTPGSTPSEANSTPVIKGTSESTPMDANDTVVEKLAAKSTDSPLTTGPVEEAGVSGDTTKESGCPGAKEEVQDDAGPSDGESGEAETAEVGEKRPFVPNREIQRQARAIRQKEAGDAIAGKHLDSLIIACKFNPVPVLKKMLKFMLPSRPVVVFCQFIDPLKDCYTYVKEEHLGLQVRLTETWFREYQVLPQRTHPEMNMSGTGGYLLTFMTSKPFESEKKS